MEYTKICTCAKQTWSQVQQTCLHAVPSLFMTPKQGHLPQSFEVKIPKTTWNHHLPGNLLYLVPKPETWMKGLPNRHLRWPRLRLLSFARTCRNFCLPFSSKMERAFWCFPPAFPAKVTHPKAVTTENNQLKMYLLQGGSLLVINEVITPISGLING